MSVFVADVIEPRPRLGRSSDGFLEEHVVRVQGQEVN